MRQITRDMIKAYDMKNLKYDFMGYNFDRYEDLNFHHLIIPKRDCEKKEIPNKGYVMWNGAILVQDTAHEYLHVIEYIDREIFEKVTKEMIEENVNRKIDIENLKRIRDLLEYFEKEHIDDKNAKGKKLVKERYLNSRIIL